MNKVSEEEKYMKLKRILISGISMMMIFTSSFATFAKAEAKEVLTLEEAIKRTTNNDIALRQSQRADELNKATLEQLYYQGEFGKDYQQMALNKEYNEKSQKVMTESIAYETSKLFDDIIAGEKNKALLDKNIELQEKQIRKLELEVSKGLKSPLDLEKAKLELKKNKDAQKTLTDSIANQYTQLNINMGTTKSKIYTLEKAVHVYEPFTFTGTLDGFISSKASQHLSVWKAEEQISVSSIVDVNKFPTGSYVGYLTEKMDKPNAEDNKDSIKKQLESVFRMQYVKMMQLEEQYVTKQEEMKVAEKDMKVANLYYEKGMLSKIEYDSKCLQFDKLTLQLEEIVNEHAQISEIMDKPYLLSGMGSVEK